MAEKKHVSGDGAKAIDGPQFVGLCPACAAKVRELTEAKIRQFEGGRTDASGVIFSVPWSERLVADVMYVDEMLENYGLAALNEIEPE